MKYGDIKGVDVANGPGVRVSLFVSGCRLNCKNCFNKAAQSFSFGTDYTQETEDHIIDLLSRHYIQGLSLLGGDPMEPENQPYILKLIKRVREELPDKDIWMWTGRTYPDDFQEGCKEYVNNITDEIFKNVDVVVDGRFIQDLFTKKIQYRGSTNQRVLFLEHGTGNILDIK